MKYQPFSPVVATPSTRYRWNTINTTTTGMMDSVVMANSPDQLVCVFGSENSWKNAFPDVMVIALQQLVLIPGEFGIIALRKRGKADQPNRQKRSFISS